MNQCFETESGQSESVSITAIEGLSITKESFEKANDEPNNKHENTVFPRIVSAETILF